MSMRIRNIKPEITKHEGLAELSRDHRLCFIYLWMLCDVEGRCEDRPRRIKAELFPYDDDVTAAVVDGWLEDLAAPREAGGPPFIVRYEVDGVRVICVPSLTKHQAFSTWEKRTASDLPPPPGEHQQPPAASPEGLRDDYRSPPVALPPDEGRRTTDEGQGTKDEGAARARGAAAAAGHPPAEHDGADDAAARPLAQVRRIHADQPPAPIDGAVLDTAGLAAMWNEATGCRQRADGKLAKKLRAALQHRPGREDWAPAIAAAARYRRALGAEMAWLTLEWLVRHPHHIDRVLGGEWDWKIPPDVREAEALERARAAAADERRRRRRELRGPALEYLAFLRAEAGGNKRAGRRGDQLAFVEGRRLATMRDMVLDSAEYWASQRVEAARRA